MHGVKYAGLIADGDSSTYKVILEVAPYRGVQVKDWMQESYPLELH